MNLLHAFARGFGYLLLLFGLPLFTMMYALFSSNMLAPSFLQGLSTQVMTITGSSILSGLTSFFISVQGLFIAGALAIIGAALIFFGSEGYSGFSKVGTEVLILAGVALVSIYTTTNYILPNVLSRFGSTGTAIGSAVLALFSPLVSTMIDIDIIFVIFGAGLVMIKFAAPYIQNLINGPVKAMKKGKPQAAKSSLYRLIGIPAGIAVMLVILSIFTIFNSALLQSSPTYNTTPIAASAASTAFQNAASTAGATGVFNLSDYYLLKGHNSNTTSAGSMSLSLEGIPLQFSLPMAFSVSKFGDPIRIDFNVDLSKLSSLLSAIANASGNSSSGSKFSVPSNLRFMIMYNDSGIVICNNINATSNIPLLCKYQPLAVNLTSVLLNINNQNTNHSILGQIFNIFNLPSLLLSPGSPQSQSSTPQLNFVNNVEYNGNECSLFDVSGSSSAVNTTGQLCISNTNGLPLFVDLTETISVGGQRADFNINFGVTSIDTNVTLQDVTTLPSGTQIS